LIIDTVGLVLFAISSGDMGSFFIDIGFHAWILWSILEFGLAKKQLTQVTLNRINLFERNIL
jgi:hypothetical protein